MDPVTVSINVDKPREEVYEYLADVANHPEFLGGMFRDWHMLRVETYGRGAGARFRSNAPLDRFGWGDVTYAEMDPPRRLVGYGRGGKYNRTKTYWEWTLDPQGSDGTRVQFTYETEPPLPTDRIMETVSRRRSWARRHAKRSLKRLRSIVEEGPSSRRRGERATVAGL